jgi:hypothetical protein
LLRLLPSPSLSLSRVESQATSATVPRDAPHALRLGGQMPQRKFSTSASMRLSTSTAANVAPERTKACAALMTTVISRSLMVTLTKPIQSTLPADPCLLSSSRTTFSLPLKNAEALLGVSANMAAAKARLATTHGGPTMPPSGNLHPPCADANLTESDHN